MSSLSFVHAGLKPVTPVVSSTLKNLHCIHVLVNHVLVRYSKIATRNWNISPCSPASMWNASMFAHSKCPVGSCPWFPYLASVVTWLISCLVERFRIAKPCCPTSPWATAHGNPLLVMLGSGWVSISHNIVSLKSWLQLMGSIGLVAVLVGD